MVLPESKSKLYKLSESAVVLEDDKKRGGTSSIPSKMPEILIITIIYRVMPRPLPSCN